VLAHLDGVINSLYLPLGDFRRPHEEAAPPTKVTLEVDDLQWAGEPVTVRARPDREGVQLEAQIIDTARNGVVTTVPLAKTGGEGWHSATFDPPGAGAYRVRITGDGVEPAADVFAVADVAAGAVA
jgi:hypothetical protein